jgi:hypothetical protein
MKSFGMQSGTHSEFVGKVTESLQGRELGKIVSLEATPQEVIVTFSKLGTSEIVYTCSAASAGGFHATLKGEKIAFTHRAFRSDMESKLAKVMEKLGATVSI